MAAKGEGEMAAALDNEGEGETVVVAEEKEGEMVAVAADKEGEGEAVKAAAEDKKEEGETVAADTKGKEKVTAVAPADNSGEEKASGKMIFVECLDGQTFEISVAAAMLSTALRNSCKIDDESDDPSGVIKVKLLHQVPSSIFPKVKEYCTKHAKVNSVGSSTVFTNTGAASSSSTSVPDPTATEEEDLKKWDKEFVNIEQWPLYNLLLAGHFLDIKGLLDITSQKVADMLKGKNSQEMRQILNISNDFTEEEQKAIKAQNPWAFPDQE